MSNPVVQYTYEPFGATSSTDPTFPNPFQYTGRENDGLIGLYFHRARYYLPALHRFASEDPIGLFGGDINFYAYVRNSPSRFPDPSGTYSFQVCGFNVDVQASATVGPINIQTDLERVSFNFLVPFVQLGAGLDISIEPPSSRAGNITEGIGRNLAVGTYFEPKPEGGLRLQGVIVAIGILANATPLIPTLSLPIGEADLSPLAKIRRAEKELERAKEELKGSDKKSERGRCIVDFFDRNNIGSRK